jgi:anti-sigma factor RsiW
MASKSAQYLSPEQLAELSALADGSLDPARRQAVEAWIASSPELLDLYERDRAAVGVLQQAAAERAPARLRLRIQGQRVRRVRGPHVRTGYGVLAGAIAAAAVAVVLVLPGGAPGSPSVSQAAGLALRGPLAPAPAPDSTDPRTKLADRFQGVYFPNYLATLGWRAVGMRRDRLDGRPATTVYYQRRDGLVAYTIVGAPALSPPSGLVTRLNGFELRAFSLASRTVVTWRRAGHTCVLSAARVPVGVLEQLAGYRASRISD